MMKTTNFFSTMVTGFIALTLLTSGGCTNNDENEQVEKCGEGDIIRHGEYVLVNGNEPRSGYAQCIFDDPATQTFGWTWGETAPDSQQSRTSTSAYLFYGQVTSGGGPDALRESGSTTLSLPVSIADLTSFTITYDVQVSTTSRYNLGFGTNDYACNINLGGCAGASLTIIIDADTLLDSSLFQKRVTINGEEYDFYRDTSRFLFSYYWFVKVRPSLSGTLQLNKFLDFLENEGYNESSMQFFKIWHIEFFQEIWGGGTGNTTIRTYSIDVKSRK